MGGAPYVDLIITVCYDVTIRANSNGPWSVTCYPTNKTAGMTEETNMITIKITHLNFV